MKKQKVEKNVRTESEITDETKEMFSAEVSKRMLDQVITVKVIHSPLKPNKNKEFWKLNVLPPVFADNTSAEEVLIQLNEEIFIRLEPSVQEIVIQKIVAGIGYDREKGKVLKNRPDICEYSLMLKTYGLETLVEIPAANIDQIVEKMKEEGAI